MDDFTNYFKNLGTSKPYLFALAPAIAVAVLNYGYISKSSSEDVRLVHGLNKKSDGAYEKESYTPVYKMTIMLLAVFYIALFSTLLYIYKEECGKSYKETAKKASMVALVPTIVLLGLFIFMGRRNASEWVKSDEGSALTVQLTQMLMVYIVSVLTINYVYLDCEKEVSTQ